MEVIRNLFKSDIVYAASHYHEYDLVVRMSGRSSYILDKAHRVVVEDIDIADSETENIYQHFDEISALIDKYLSSSKKVLINCHAGKSRSATIVAAYLVRFKNMSAVSAVGTMVQSINDGFMSQLCFYWKRNYILTYLLIKTEIYTPKTNEDGSINGMLMSRQMDMWIDSEYSRLRYLSSQGVMCPSDCLVFTKLANEGKNLLHILLCILI